MHKNIDTQTYTNLYTQKYTHTYTHIQKQTLADCLQDRNATFTGNLTSRKSFSILYISPPLSLHVTQFHENKENRLMSMYRLDQ